MGSSSLWGILGQRAASEMSATGRCAEWAGTAPGEHDYVALLDVETTSTL